ncbi:glycoside hydrolase family 5 protein [Butyrivibrio sp. FC2001]|uniref:glycoside hydrolase family 5 protein n=1 Tax=Butyrivibrio sp. FC2001 TaxID=1280671 RepID=UPI0003FF03A1|nr:glycoside hydrolase family 5 protein [Butyrivibrio sp. FC2001]
MKKTYIVAIMMMVIIVSYVVSDYMVSLGHDNNELSSIETVQDEIMEENTTTPSDEVEEAESVYAALGRGFNLGNDLDVCDWTYFGSNNDAGFQASVVYNSYPWTSWDASSYPYFDSSGKVTINWELSKLTSKADAFASNFGIQLVNHNEAYQGTEVTCTVKSATLSYPDGTTVELVSKNGMSVDLVVNDGVTGYISLDLMKYGIKTSDLKDASIRVSLEISNYYSDVAGKIASLEKSWGNPLATEEMIKSIKGAGFKTVRVPVTYFNHLDHDGNIDEEFLDRVEEVVDWVLKNDMYCIIDVHHDTGNDGWIKASKSNYEMTSSIIASIFTQIAERFKDKDEHLILEGLNETVNDDNKWGGIPREDLEIMNDWNQLFVNAVRATGGKNSNRILIVNTYAALATEECLSAFKLPLDTANDRILVGIHCYFTGDNMDSGFGTIQDYASDYHFVIGEWAFWKGANDRVENVRRYCEHADKFGIPIIWWDNGNTEEMALLDRKTLSWTYQDIVNVLVGK